MIGIEWNVPASLTTDAGTLNFNTFPGLILVPGSCAANKVIRAPVDPVPQGDGDILHRKWQTGYQYKLVCQAWETENSIACDEDARLLGEQLGLHLYAMLRSRGRYCWTPTNYGDNRALDEAYWFEGVTQSLSDGGIVQFEFSIDSPFPYAIDLTQQAIALTDGGTTTITNAGNCDFYPVIQVQGPTSGFNLSNFTALQGLNYDASRPGADPIAGGHYAEIDTFKGTIYLDGDGADLSAGIDPEVTNLEEPLKVMAGANDFQIVGASATVLMNHSWC